MKTDQILRKLIFTGLFIIPFIPFLVSSSLFFPFITTKAFAWRFIVEVIFAAWLVLAAYEPAYRPKKSPILYALLAFLAIIGLANIFGEAPLKSFWSNYERMEGYITLLHLGMFFAVISSFFDEIDWRRWWNTSLAASALMVIYCLFQLLGSIQIYQGGVRVDGTLGNATYLAVYMLFHIFIAALFMWRERKNVGLKWTYATLIFFQALILYYTATRGAILGLLGGALLVALLNIRNRENRVMRRASVSVLAILVLVVGGFFALRQTAFVQNSPVLSRFANISTEELKSGGRSFVWPMAIEGIKERPLLGWGQDNFNYVFNEHYDPNMFRLEPWFDRAHNIFLDWAVAGGVLGLLSYLSLYLTLLWLLWKRSSFSFEERSIITGGVAAYFFHNFFVFDQLISYIMFFALLAYIHRSAHAESAKETGRTLASVFRNVATAGAAILLAAGLYFVEWKPLTANTALIGALQAMGQNNHMLAMEKLEYVYHRSRLGRPEAVEQISAHTTTLLGSNLPEERRNEFFRFAKEAVINQAEELDTDARYQIVAGTFLSRTGAQAESLAYFDRAQKLIPGKQLVYFEAGGAMLATGNEQEALALFKHAYELAPEYQEAKIIYLTGAIYAGDRALEQRLTQELPRRTVVMDDRIIGAYYTIGRKSDVVALLEERIKFDPANEATYREYIKQVMP